MEYKGLVSDDPVYYFVSKRFTHRQSKLSGHFIFKMSSETMKRRVKSGFSGKLSWFCYTSSDIAEAKLSNPN